MTQVSTTELFGNIKDVQESNNKILKILDKHGTPNSSEKIKDIGSEIADMLSTMIYEKENVNKKIGVDLEFIGDKPRFALYVMPSEEGCGTGNCG